MIDVPEFFADRLAMIAGDPARVWLEQLPESAAEYAERWQLTLDGRVPMYGYAGVVLPCTRADGTEAVLKLGFVGPETRDEPRALAAWGGDGAVRLYESDPGRGAMVLERLDAGRSLEDEPIDDAVRIISVLLRRLAIEGPSDISRSLRTEAQRWALELPEQWRRLGQPFPRVLLDAAVDVCEQLGPSAGTLLVNEDLHYENVLGATREPWLVIDPQPLIGDIEFTTLSLLWNRMNDSDLDARFAAVVEIAGLDADRARAWTLVRSVQNWLWFVEDEDTEDFGWPAVQVIAPWALGGSAPWALGSTAMPS
ncbi:aminoglycoside phosphotransferase family protein [Nocardia sp. NPDC050710]|uniref:aminoglycoside phosphotransferase family protein n=1 Tax=Nocardia sp. NPDC050710 TaxID=3157220 RepID=UPI0034051EEF